MVAGTARAWLVAVAAAAAAAGRPPAVAYPSLAAWVLQLQGLSMEPLGEGQ